MATAAPTQAPPETPSKSGDTNGLRKIPWNVAPATASAEPTKMGQECAVIVG